MNSPLLTKRQLRLVSIAGMSDAELKVYCQYNPLQACQDFDASVLLPDYRLAKRLAFCLNELGPCEATDGIWFTAAECGWETVIESQLKRHLSPDRRKSDRKTALHVAAQFGHTKCVLALLRHGARAIAVDSRGKTAGCCARDSQSMLSELLDQVVASHYRSGVASGPEQVALKRILNRIGQSKPSPLAASIIDEHSVILKKKKGQPARVVFENERVHMAIEDERREEIKDALGKQARTWLNSRTFRGPH